MAILGQGNRISVVSAKGEKLFSISEVLKIMNKPALIYWANKLGLAGTALKDYYATKSSAGNLAHELIQSCFTGQKVVTQNYTEEEITLANVSLAKFKSWAGDINPETVKVIGCEMTVTDDDEGYGGRVDLFYSKGEINTLFEIKTSTDVYMDQKVQAVAQAALLIKNDFPVGRILLGGFPVDETPGKVVEIPNLEWVDLYSVFTNMLTLTKACKKVDPGFRL